ncbi:MAG: SAM-dependent methyltransferase [Acidobacteriia bacterium]|nr:SAM-dependent methyltransferase [Terriglobia bacterium]
MSRRSPVVRREAIEAKPDPEEPDQVTEDSRFLIPWLLLFAGSGCAALIYEIVWFQLLQLVIGSSAVSLGLLLAAYMGGLSLGSAALPRMVARRLHPMRVYALLELGTGVFGILALFGVPLVGHLYVAGATSGIPGVILRGVVAAVCLLPPTVLMGASLPAMARWVEATPRGVSWLGLLYSANIAGAVVGSVFAGFYLLRVHDLAVATYTAAAINGAVSLLAWMLAGRVRYGAGEAGLESGSEARRASGFGWIYLAIGLSGLTALGAEVVWTRVLSLLLGATVYTFSIILAVFLIGLWGGSWAGSFLARRLREPRVGLAVCQMLLAAAIAWTAFHLADVLPYWPVDPWLSTNPWINFDLDWTRCVRAILPATLLWGASFPLALAGAAGAGEDPARLTGEIYAVNTAGSIVGALAFSLLLIPGIGTRASQQCLIVLAAGAAAAALAAAAFQGKRMRWAPAGGALVGMALLTWGLTAVVDEMPWQAVAYGRRIAPFLHNTDPASGAETKPLFVGEGINSSVVIAERNGQRFFYVSGKSEASSAPLDMRLQRMMGHIPALAQGGPRSVLVVGFGAGVTAGSFVPYPEVQSITICELEPLIPPASDRYFGQENYHVLQDRRTRLVTDDARHYILTTSERFDVITTDPIHPWVKGTSPLYSKEYYELVKQHLNPGGVVAQWLPLYESNEQTVQTELATFFAVFPKATVWSTFTNGDGYDLVLLARDESVPLNLDAIQKRLSGPGYSAVSASLADVGFPSAVELLATYAGRATDLAPMLTHAQMNDDLNLRLQYIAGMGVNSLLAPRIYQELLTYRSFPEDLLTGTGAGMDRVRELIGRRHRVF